jgi:hypothetical protein
MPIHEFCPRNPSQLLPNERGACQRGYERSVPLLSSICSRCLELLTHLDHQHSEHAVEAFVSNREAQRHGVKSCEVDLRRGSVTSEDDDFGRSIVLNEQGKSGCVGAVVLPVGVKGVQIAWQQ